MVRGLLSFLSRQRGTARARLAVNASWTLVATLSTYATTALGGILAARILGTVGFGQLGIIRSTVVTFSVLAGTGLGIGATKYVAELRRLDPERAGRVLGLLFNVSLLMGGAAAAAVLFLAEPLASSFLSEPALVTPLRAAALLLLLGSFSGVQVGALGGFEAFRTIAWITAVEGAISLAAIVAGAWLAGVTGAVLGTAFGMLVTLPLKYMALTRRCSIDSVAVRQRGVFVEARVLRAFVVPAFIVAVSVQPFEWIARLLLAHEADGFTQVGLFTAAFAWGQFVLFLPGQVIGPGMPILADLFAHRRTRELRRLSRDMIAVTGLFAGATAVLIGLLSMPLMRVYGAEFTAARETLLVLLAAHWLAAFTVFLRNFFTATEQMWLQALHAVLWGVALITSFLLLERSALGLAWAYVIGYSVSLLAQGATAAVFVRRHLGAAGQEAALESQVLEASRVQPGGVAS